MERKPTKVTELPKDPYILTRMPEEFRAENMEDFDEVYWGGSDKDEEYASLAHDPTTGNWYAFVEDSRFVGPLERMVKILVDSGYKVLLG